MDNKQKMEFLSQFPDFWNHLSDEEKEWYIENGETIMEMQKLVEENQ